jgi:hypothetical protein
MRMYIEKSRGNDHVVNVEGRYFSGFTRHTFRNRRERASFDEHIPCREIGGGVNQPRAPQHEPHAHALHLRPYCVLLWAP